MSTAYFQAHTQPYSHLPILLLLKFALKVISFVPFALSQPKTQAY